MMGTRLSKAQLDAWDEDGFFISDLVIDPATIARMRARFDLVFYGIYTDETPNIRSWNPGDPPDRIRQMAFAWRVDAVLRASALNAAIGEIAVQLARSKSMRLLMDWIVHKPGIGSKANPSTGVGYHQDQCYWQSFAPANLLTARIPLDNETRENGCMSVIPGSHRLGLRQELGDGFWNAGESGQQLHPALSDCGLPSATTCELEAGRVMFHHCLLVHGTGQNRTDKPRRSQNIHMMPGETVYLPGRGTFFEDYAARHGTRLEPGQVNEAALFPEIYTRKLDHPSKRAKPVPQELPAI